MANIRLSVIDEQRFGVRTAKADDITKDSISDLRAFCDENEVEFSIVRVQTTDLDAVQALEDDGYRLMDTLVYYTFKFVKKPIPSDSRQHILRPVESDEIDEVISIAQASFQGYYGHYHADERLNDAKCNEVYIDWAKNSVTSRDVADEVLVAEGDSQLNGFATLRLNSPDEGEGVLFGVAPHAQGQGIYRSMMIHGMNWCKSQGTQAMVVSTQVTNIAVQKVWARLGFEMDKSYYTLHKWF